MAENKWVGVITLYLWNHNQNSYLKDKVFFPRLTEGKIGSKLLKNMTCQTGCLLVIQCDLVRNTSHKTKNYPCGGDLQPPKNKITAYWITYWSKSYLIMMTPRVRIKENIFERSTQKVEKRSGSVWSWEKWLQFFGRSQEVSPWQEMIGSMVVRITGWNTPLFNRAINWGCQSFPKLLGHPSKLSKADCLGNILLEVHYKTWVWMMLFQIPQIHQLLEEMLLNIFAFSKWQCCIIEQSPLILRICKYRKWIYWTFELWPNFTWFSSKLKHSYAHLSKYPL